METRIDHDPLTLSDFDEVLLSEMGTQPSTIIHLSKCSKHFYSFFSNVRALPLAQKCLQQLLSHAALGEYDSAECIWKGFPDLLTCRGIIFHPNNTYVEGEEPLPIPIKKNPGRYKYVGPNEDGVTAWQIALMNEEYERAEEMGKMMTAEEKQKQFFEIFPDGIIAKYDWNLEYATQLLQDVFDALAKDKSVSKMCGTHSLLTIEALNTLYDYVKSQSKHKTGLVFDINLYMKAREIYDNQSNKLATWKYHQIWCIKVEEWLAANLGTVYLRQHAQGKSNCIAHQDCKLAHNESYFAFRCPPNEIPGHDIFVGDYGQASFQNMRGLYWAWKNEKSKKDFDAYVQQQQEKRNEFAREYTKKPSFSL